MAGLFFSILFNIPAFIKWKFYDFTHRKPQYPYGVYGFVGLYGGGKTIGMVRRIYEMKKKYPKAKVMTNFGFIQEDLPITSVDDIWKYYDPDGIIICLDEVHNDFFSRDWQNFPQELNVTMSQCRKLKKMILYTVQRENFADSIIRSLTHKLYVCTNPFRNARLFIQKEYYTSDYDFELETSELRKRAIGSHAWVASNHIHDSYDTLKVIGSIRGFGNLMDKSSRIGTFSEKTPLSMKLAPYSLIQFRLDNMVNGLNIGYNPRPSIDITSYKRPKPSNKPNVSQPVVYVETPPKLVKPFVDGLSKDYLYHKKRIYSHARAVTPKFSFN